MKLRLPLLMLIHQRKWKNSPPPRTHSVTQRASALHSLIARVAPVESLMSDSDYTEMPSDWREQAFENPSSLIQETTQLCGDAFKMHVHITPMSWSYFFPHFGHRSVASRSSSWVSDLGAVHLGVREGNVSDWGLFKQPALPCWTRRAVEWHRYTRCHIFILASCESFPQSKDIRELRNRLFGNTPGPSSFIKRNHHLLCVWINRWMTFPHPQ